LILKNIYALGAGIAHGLDYGDNFLSVLIANSADERGISWSQVSSTAVANWCGWLMHATKQT
jgi:hypothetical protein